MTGKGHELSRGRRGAGAVQRRGGEEEGASELFLPRLKNPGNPCLALHLEKLRHGEGLGLHGGGQGTTRDPLSQVPLPCAECCHSAPLTGHPCLVSTRDF